MRAASAPAVLLVALVLWPAVSPAQEAGHDGSGSVERRRTRRFIRPLPPAAEVEQDTDRAVEALRAQRRDQLVRENLPHLKPPYADSDLTRGIQSQNVLKALSRR